jgi:hypothetical protein
MRDVWSGANAGSMTDSSAPVRPAPLRVGQQSWRLLVATGTDVVIFHDGRIYGFVDTDPA